jgi:hypothetical protein
MKDARIALTALALNCTLKAEGESSTDAMIGVLADCSPSTK